jgi:hypothetical protein
VCLFVLYVLERTLDQVTLVDDELVYQIGETAEILSRGHLCATPHCVKVFSNQRSPLSLSLSLSLSLLFVFVKVFSKWHKRNF